MAESINCPRSYDQPLMTTTFVLSLIFNLVFLILIEKHSSSAIKPYKRVLVVSAVTDIACSINFLLIIIVSGELWKKKLTKFFVG
jgi:hypothetical protein